MPDTVARVIRQGPQIGVLVNGKLVVEFPYQAAAEIGRLLLHHAKCAEEQEKALMIIKDEAVIRRLGLPFSLTSDPVIREEAFRESQYVPAPPGVTGIPSRSAPGVPTISNIPS